MRLWGIARQFFKVCGPVGGFLALFRDQRCCSGLDGDQGFGVEAKRAPTATSMNRHPIVSHQGHRWGNRGTQRLWSEQRLHEVIPHW